MPDPIEIETFFIQICKTDGGIPRHCYRCIRNVDGAGCQHPKNPFVIESKKSLQEKTE